MLYIFVTALSVFIKIKANFSKRTEIGVSLYFLVSYLRMHRKNRIAGFPIQYHIVLSPIFIYNVTLQR